MTEYRHWLAQANVGSRLPEERPASHRRSRRSSVVGLDRRWSTRAGASAAGPRAAHSIAARTASTIGPPKSASLTVPREESGRSAKNSRTART